ncbi:small GTPase superfamily [Pisolithus orientalis]|uniref:small GTPase superfamily n=1 Tax=Pisolithus orientalis TaxID=936130 RepID=UPI0022244924|nr:small GTPase superfamily [Pisolithus orientalis]KAI6035352.1 small GTPase superfamily [Pisolithus orientalis]KAI6151948.1 small GTPase superfamily [Pisolithus tinctorius]
MAASSTKKRKIAVLGSRSVGKSSLVVQFIENHFVDSYYPTIENTFSKVVAYKGVEYDCDIIDTAGQDEYSILNSKHAIGIHGYVLVYSIASRRSFDMVKIVYDKIIDFCGKNEIPCVIVGAKSDLQSSRQVQPGEAEELAKTKQAAWVETSAKNNVNVGKVFELCLAEIEKRSPRSQADQPEPGKCIIM